MGHRVRFHDDFRRDLRAQLTWITRNGDPAWIERLRHEIANMRRLLARFPDIGTIEARSGTWVLRRFVLSDAPYVIWFARDTSASSADIWLTRLFHAHQRRPRPSARLAGAPPARKG